VAAAADLAASVLNPSLDSWDQAPAASALEAEVTAALAELVYPAAVTPDALITSGGTESNLVALLLARESGEVRPVCATNAHHSVARAAWVLGMPAPVTVPCERGRLRPDALAEALAGLGGPAVVVATAGSTGAGTIDPLDDIAQVCARHGAWLHVDAAYGGGALLSSRLRPLLAGIERADSVGFDLHKFGWQPIATGVLAVADAGVLAPLATTADYLNAADDTESGLPDLLGRSLRTSRRPDVVKIATTFRALGRAGLAAMIEHCCANAASLAERIDADPRFELWQRPQLSTVLLRPRGATDDDVATIRRRLLDSGEAVVGRATAPDAAGTDRLWLKLTLLHPHASASDYEPLLQLVAAAAQPRRRPA
jgi:L-2,4-diaminobutyrate decarboxylase